MSMTNQSTVRTIIGSKGAEAPYAITPVALTNAYGPAATTKSFIIEGMTKLNMNVQYRTGASEAASSINIKIENSADNVNWFRLPNEAVTGGVSALTDREFSHAGGAGNTTYNFSFGIDVFYSFIKISVKESGVTTNAGSVFMEVDFQDQF